MSEVVGVIPFVRLPFAQLNSVIFEFELALSGQVCFLIFVTEGSF